jgi:hypothetical protein
MLSSCVCVCALNTQVQIIRDIRLRTGSKTNMAAFYRVTTMYIEKLFL